MNLKEIEQTLESVEMDKGLREAVLGWIRLAYRCGWEEGLKMGHTSMANMFTAFFDPKGKA